MTREIATSVAEAPEKNTHSWCRCHAPRPWFRPTPILPPRLAKQGACHGSSSRQCALQSAFAMATPRPMRYSASEIRHSTTPLPPVVALPPMQPILLYSEVVRSVKATGSQSEKNARYSPSCKSAFPPPQKPKAARNSGKRKNKRRAPSEKQNIHAARQAPPRQQVLVDTNVPTLSKAAGSSSFYTGR